MMAEGLRPLFEDPDAPAPLREFVALARADGPSQTDLRRLATGVALRSGETGLAAPSVMALESPPAEIGVTPGAVGTRPAGQVVHSGAAKIVAAIALAMGLGLGGWVARKPATQPNPPSAPAGRRVSAAPNSAALHARPPQRNVEVVLGQSAATTELANAAAPEAGATPAQERALPPELRSLAPAPGLARAKHSAAPPSELELIARAEAARGRVDEALALLAQHERLYPRGTLAQEREALAIEVLLRTGQRDRADARARRFARDYPDSAHGPRLRALLEASARSDAHASARTGAHLGGD